MVSGFSSKYDDTTTGRGDENVLNYTLLTVFTVDCRLAGAVQMPARYLGTRLRVRVATRRLSREMGRIRTHAAKPCKPEPSPQSIWD